jgi:hypothetical protein
MPEVHRSGTALRNNSTDCQNVSRAKRRSAMPSIAKNGMEIDCCWENLAGNIQWVRGGDPIAPVNANVAFGDQVPGLAGVDLSAPMSCPGHGRKPAPDS